jgi:hypothetical protein
VESGGTVVGARGEQDHHCEDAEKRFHGNVLWL